MTVVAERFATLAHFDAGDYSDSVGDYSAIVVHSEFEGMMEHIHCPDKAVGINSHPPKIVPHRTPNLSSRHSLVLAIYY
jgi:hypothetical protein